MSRAAADGRSTRWLRTHHRLVARAGHDAGGQADELEAAEVVELEALVRAHLVEHGREGREDVVLDVLELGRRRVSWVARRRPIGRAALLTLATRLFCFVQWRRGSSEAPDTVDTSAAARVMTLRSCILVRRRGARENVTR